MDDKLNFLTDPQGTAPAAAPEAQPTPQPDPVIAPEVVADPVGQPRDEQGRFAPLNPEPQTPPDGVTPPPANPATPPAGHVPVTALQEERARRQALEAEIQRYQQAQMESGIPDPYADPEGYNAFLQQQVQGAAMTVKLDLSEDMARAKHGDETVDRMLEWAKDRFASSRAYQQEVLRQRNPYEFAMQAYQAEERQKAFAGVEPSELAAFQQWRAAQNPLAGAPPAASPTPVTPPPQSLAAAPSAGVATHVPIGPGVAFDGLFKR